MNFDLRYHIKISKKWKLWINAAESDVMLIFTVCAYKYKQNSFRFSNFRQTNAMHRTKIEGFNNSYALLAPKAKLFTKPKRWEFEIVAVVRIHHRFAFVLYFIHFVHFQLLAHNGAFLLIGLHFIWVLCSLKRLQVLIITEISTGYKLVYISLLLSSSSYVFIADVAGVLCLNFVFIASTLLQWETLPRIEHKVPENKFIKKKSSDRMQFQLIYSEFIMSLHHHPYRWISTQGWMYKNNNYSACWVSNSQHSIYV